MANCPNCGLSTMRTKDWACQWCGYPLVSGIYGKTSKTFAELKQERESEAVSTALLVEIEPTTEPETSQVVETRAEPVPEPETSQIVETRAEPVPEPETSQVVETRAEPVPEPETSQVVETRAEPVPEPETSADEEIQPIPEVTVTELCSTYQGYGMAGHEEFKNSVFRVSGIVDSVVTKDVVEQYRVALTDKEPHPLGDIYCKFEKKDAPALSKLVVGQELTVQGRYDGFVTNIVLADCVMVS